MRKLFLPRSHQNNPISIKIGQYISKLTCSSLFFSVIVFSQGQKYRFLSKDQSFPFVEFDWTMYCCMRSWARTIITTATTLKKQPLLYSNDRGCFGKQQLQQLFKNNTLQKQNTLVFTKSMTNTQISSILSKDCFNFIASNEYNDQNKDNSIFKMAKYGIENKMGPIILQNGNSSMLQFLQHIEQNKQNLIDLIVLSIFEGYMPQKYIQGDFYNEWLDQNLKKVWESPKIETKVNDQQQIREGSLKFVIYAKQQ